MEEMQTGLNVLGECGCLTRLEGCEEPFVFFIETVRGTTEVDGVAADED